MKSQSPQSTESDRAQTEIELSEGIAKEVFLETSKGLLKEAAVTLRLGISGAAVGAVLLAGSGCWKFGFTGLWIGAIAGALVGGVGAIVLYTMGGSLTS
jgi:hypothetical protein